MLKLIFAGFILACASGSACAQDVDILPQNSNVSPVSRTTIVVRDIDESLKLYRDILGLKPRLERTLEGNWWNELMNTKGKKLQVVVLNTGNGETIGNIGLFHFVGEHSAPPPKITPQLQTGQVALVMVVRDIHATYQKVKDAGYAFISPPKEGPEHDGMTAWEMMFFDRDGVVVNLAQLPHKK